MPRPKKSYTEQEKTLGLSALEAYRGDAARASKFCGIPEHVLRFWQQGGDENAEKPATLALLDGIPMPPEHLLDPLRYPVQFTPSHELATWALETIIESGGALYNESHWHLSTAKLGVLWTNAGFEKHGCVIAGTAEIPMPKKDWSSARWMHRLMDWFGEVPDGLITLDSVLWASASNATRCARLDHELCHLAIKTNRSGEPMFDRATGKPRLRLQGHDVGEFVDMVSRYGPGAAAGQTAALVRAASRAPLFDDEEIDLACGLCSR